MNAAAILLAAAAILLGFATLQGVNPVDKVIRGFIWLLYQMAALFLAMARTADSAYLTLRKEYKKSVKQMDAERDKFKTLEEEPASALIIRPGPLPTLIEKSS